MHGLTNHLLRGLLEVPNRHGGEQLAALRLVASAACQPVTGELFRKDLLRRNEWWIPDLARELGAIAVKVHYWIKQGWIHYRRSPSGKHLIVWADRDELQRLRKLEGKKTSWFAAKHPELIILKKRRAS